jgi:hypothetical protein
MTFSPVICRHRRTTPGSGSLPLRRSSQRPQTSRSSRTCKRFGCRGGVRPAGVERQVRHDLAQLFGCHAVLERQFHMVPHIGRTKARNVGCDGDEAPVALAEPGALPDISHEHVPASSANFSYVWRRYGASCRSLSRLPLVAVVKILGDVFVPDPVAEPGRGGLIGQGKNFQFRGERPGYGVKELRVLSPRRRLSSAQSLQ